MKNNHLAILLIEAFFLVVTCEKANSKGGSCNKTTRNVTLEQITEPVTHAEGPHWDSRSETLFFVDIPNQRIYRWDPKTGKVVYVYVENGPVGVAVTVEGSPDQLVAGSGTDFVLVNWDGRSNSTNPVIETLATVDRDRNGTRWNDGKVDSSGRFWGGTMGPEVNMITAPHRGSLYRITSNLIPLREITNVTVSNGEAWNIEDNTFYYIDSDTYQISAFDYDPFKGTIANRRVVFDLKEKNISGTPDGMTIDTDGNLWVALFGGHRVIHVDPRKGELILSVKIPAHDVTSVMFGGPLYDILYVTTSRRGLSAEELEKQPLAGSVFAVKGLGVQGFKANSFVLDRSHN